MKFKIKRNWKSILCAVLVFATLIGACAGIATFAKKDTKTIGSSAFSVGAIDSKGVYISNSKSIYTKEMFECGGLTIEPDFEATGNFQVFYYDSDKKFVGATDVFDAADGVYSKADDFVTAKYCRIMITPEAVDDEGNADKDFKIRFWNVSSYANDYTITVNKNQEENNIVYYGENKFVNNKNSNASYGNGADGFELSSLENGIDISNLVSIEDCTNICIKVRKNIYKQVTLNFLKQSEYHTGTTLDKFNFDIVEVGENYYLSMVIDSGFKDDVAINISGIAGVDLNGTEIYVW